jgi:hypothetical protein
MTCINTFDRTAPPRPVGHNSITAFCDQTQVGFAVSGLRDFTITQLQLRDVQSVSWRSKGNCYRNRRAVRSTCGHSLTLSTPAASNAQLDYSGNQHMMVLTPTPSTRVEDPPVQRFTAMRSATSTSCVAIRTADPCTCIMSLHKNVVRPGT